MDLDAYVQRHGPQWDRLTELTTQRARLSGAEADEVVDLYQRTATHLSVVRSTSSDPILEARLSTLVANARSLVTGVTLPVWSTVGRFFTVVFPAAVYRARVWWLSVLGINVALFALMSWRIVNTPGLADALVDPGDVDQLVDHDFASYYSENPAGDFAFEIWVNNAKITAVCLVLGIAIIPVLVVLWQNIANVAIIGGYMTERGRADIFYGLILPHGMLELTIIFVAAGAGLRMGWSWIAPGRRSRSEALVTEGRALGAMALGLAVWLLISGLVEAFVTPSQLPAWTRLLIGALVWLAFGAYVFILGRRAAEAGQTGDVEEELEASVPTEVA